MQRREKNILNCKKEEGQFELVTDYQTKPALQPVKDRNQQYLHTDQVLNIF
jgi:TFIIF-interacting CTD phosphatase-like protein